MENKVKDFRELIKKTFGKNSGILIEDADNIKIEKFPSGSFFIRSRFKRWMGKRNFNRDIWRKPKW